MKEYIEKTAARNAVKRVIGDQDHTCKAMMDFYVALNEAPAADVVEVRHGRWIPEACESVSKRNRLIEYRVYSCSICGRSNGRVKKKYCPNCGTRMDKEVDHEAD